MVAKRIGIPNVLLSIYKDGIVKNLINVLNVGNPSALPRSLAYIAKYTLGGKLMKMIMQTFSPRTPVLLHIKNFKLGKKFISVTCVIKPFLRNPSLLCMTDFIPERDHIDVINVGKSSDGAQTYLDIRKAILQSKL